MKPKTKQKLVPIALAFSLGIAVAALAVAITAVTRTPSNPTIAGNVRQHGNQHANSGGQTWSVPDNVRIPPSADNPQSTSRTPSGGSGNVRVGAGQSASGNVRVGRDGASANVATGTAAGAQFNLGGAQLSAGGTHNTSANVGVDRNGVQVGGGSSTTIGLGGSIPRPPVPPVQQLIPGRVRDWLR